jgi:hypothetical protein
MKIEIESDKNILIHLEKIDIKENYSHKEVTRNLSMRQTELDIYLPNEKLAFEYQGEHHFNDIYALGNKWIQQQKDEEKRKLCIENEITLIEIPYWWNNEKSNLIATIHKHRPDLMSNEKLGNGIPIEIDQESIKGIYFLSSSISLFLLFSD